MKENKKATNKAKREYLLSGLIECEECGATYVGHTSTNKRGYEIRYYCCGDKYRTRTCNSKSIKADELETFVVYKLKEYLTQTNYDEMAEFIANAVNSASVDLSKEKKELAEITAQISNGVKAVLSGMVFPEFEKELDKLRIRKSELEDIIQYNERHKTKIDKKKIVELFKFSAENFDNNVKDTIKNHVTRIYAHADGTFTVNVGVHITSSGRGI